MEYKIAYDREKDLEFFLYPQMTIDNGFICSGKKTTCLPDRLGTLLLNFLNTDFEKLEEVTFFMHKYCFYTLYTRKNFPQKNNFYSTRLKFSIKDYVNESQEFAKEYQDMFLYVQHLCLYYLNMPYNIECLKENFDDEIDYDYSRMINTDRSNININNMILPLEDISLDFNMFDYLFIGRPLYSFNVPYAFSSYDFFSIISLELREFLSLKQHIIRKCQNCENYFIPNNLKETKYCNEEDIITRKTCKKVGRNFVYKKSLQEDPPLELYRKRYMSLASSVSHYGTDKAVERFEKYKIEGSIMKQKYLNREISAQEFEQWINDSKKSNK